MGSAGTGRFGDYHIGGKTSTSVPSGNSVGGSGGGGYGDAGGFPSRSHDDVIRLEDVATSQYYTEEGTLPHSGEVVRLHRAVHEGRLAVELAATGQILGNLPTEYNYFLRYIDDGTPCSGHVVSSGEVPVPFITVTLHV